MINSCRLTVRSKWKRCEAAAGINTCVISCQHFLTLSCTNILGIPFMEVKKKKKKSEKDASVCSETESLERVCLARFENNSYLKIM